MTALPKYVSGRQLAELWGCSDRAVRALAKRGIAVRVARGKYDLEKSTRNNDERLRAAAAGRNEGDLASPELTYERTLLVRANREKAELELAFRRGELVNRAEEQAKAIEVVVNTRNRLLSVAERCSHRLGLKRDVTLALDEEIRQALTELSQMGEPQ
jgi:phage terminase Nu1 subunit (DNA packaging protein)